MDKIDWEILNELSDDHETIKVISSSIENHLISTADICMKLIRLKNLGYIIVIDDRGKMISDIRATNIDDNMWFGLTVVGGKTMEKRAKEFCGEEIKWDNATSINFNYKKLKGHIYARTEKRCRKLLIEIIRNKTSVKILEDSISLSEIFSYRYKYYKILEGGFLLKFKFKNI